MRAQAGHRAKWISAVTALIVLGVIVQTAFAREDAQNDEEWNYSDKGPVTWPEAFPQFCDGTEQSPIDIEEVNAKPDPGGRDLEIDYAKRTSLTVLNNTHAVEARVPEGAGKLTFDGKEYELKQFHFHTPSEHELSGYDHPVEMHLVHVAEDGSTAVVGVLFRRGKANGPLKKVWRDLPDVDDSRTITVRNFRLNRLIPKRVDAFHYMGSLTTPTCDEGVSWFVLDKVRPMSNRQIRKLQRIFSGEEFPSGNARPVQRFKVPIVEVGVKK